MEVAVVFKKSILLGGFASLMGVGFLAMPAQAAVVTSWDFTVSDGFTAYTCTGGGSACITATNLNPDASLPATFHLPTLIEWGTPCCSNLNLGGTAPNYGLDSGTLTTNAAPTSTVTVTANNNTITGNSLTTATIRDVLQLTAETPPPAGSPFTLPQLSFDIVYDETPNVSGSCPINPTSGNPPCPDILAIANLSNAGFNTSNPNDIFIQQLLPYNGENYDVELFITGLQLLGSAACADVDTADGLTPSSPDYLTSGCIGFVSQEGKNNSYTASLAILDAGSIPTVPEPFTLSLFGAGLAGAAALRRRKPKSV
jgi:hypothetical protein